MTRLSHLSSIRSIIRITLALTALLLAPASVLTAQSVTATLSESVATTAFGGHLESTRLPLDHPTEPGAPYLFVADVLRANPMLGTTTGCVEVYRRLHATWIHVQTLFPSIGANETFFGGEISALEDRLLISAPADAFASEPGRVFVFEFQGGQWVETAVIDSGSSGSSPNFGEGLAQYDSKIFIGDPQMDFIAGGAGIVYEFERDSVTDTWTETNSFSPTSSGDVRLFGSQLECAFSGSSLKLVISAPTSYDDIGYLEHQGSIDIFEFSPFSNSWSVDGTIQSPGLNGWPSDMALDRSARLYVGAYLLDVSGVPQAGGVQVYSGLSAQWNLIDEISSPTGPVSGEQYGRYLSLDEDRLLVSSPPLFSPLFPGRVDVFERAGFSVFEDAPTVSLEPQAPVIPSTRFGFNALAVEDELLVQNRDFLGDSAVERWLLPPNGKLLNVAPTVLSMTDGGVQSMRIAAGEENGGKIYWVFGSFSGSRPGFVYQGHNVALNLPDNQGPFDYFNYSLLAPATGAAPLVNSLGLLDANGEATSEFVVPAGTPVSFAGEVVTHVAVIFDIGGPLTVRAVSNPETVGLADELPAELVVTSFPGRFNDSFGTYQINNNTYAPPTPFSIQLGMRPGTVAPTSFDWTWTFDGMVTATLSTTEPSAIGVPVDDVGLTIIEVDAIGGSGTSLPFEIPVRRTVTPTPCVQLQGPYSLGDLVVVDAGCSTDPDGGQIIEYDFQGIPVPDEDTEPETYSFTLDPNVFTSGQTFSAQLQIIDDDFESNGFLLNFPITIL